MSSLCAKLISVLQPTAKKTYLFIPFEMIHYLPCNCYNEDGLEYFSLHNFIKIKYELYLPTAEINLFILKRQPRINWNWNRNLLSLLLPICHNHNWHPCAIFSTKSYCVRRHLLDTANFNGQNYLYVTQLFL